MPISISIKGAMLSLLQLPAGFYLPGVAPIDYPVGAKIDLKVRPARRVGLRGTVGWHRLSAGHEEQPFDIGR